MNFMAIFVTLLKGISRIMIVNVSLQRKIVSQSGQPMLAQPQLSPQPKLDLAATLQQQQQKRQASPQPQQISPVTSIQPAASVLNTVHINLANPGMAATASPGEAKVQTAACSTRTTQSLVNPVCLAAGPTPATNSKIQIPANLLQHAQQQQQHQQHHQHQHQHQHQQQQHHQQSLLNTNPIIVTTCVGGSTSNKLSSKATMNDFLKNQALNPGLIKPMVMPMSTVATAGNTSVPFVFTATPPKMTTSANGLNTIRWGGRCCMCLFIVLTY